MEAAATIGRILRERFLGTGRETVVFF